MKQEISIESKEEKELREKLGGRSDAEAMRLTRFLAMPDLSRKDGSPIRELAKKITNLQDFKDFYVLKVPEIVPARESFDLFNFPPDHPARSRSDTYYVNDDYILRTHTTIMWYYQLGLPEMQEKIARGEAVGALCHGKVYRKDELDRKHMNVFHQIDGWYLCRRDEKQIGIDDLKDVLVKIIHALYGEDVHYRFNQDQFPYTDPSVEMEIEVDDPSTSSGQGWVEVLGSGVVRPQVLKNLGIDPEVYNGWAFGFGFERLAILSMKLPDIRLLWSDDPRVTRQLVLGKPYQEVSKYPPITRDISFVVRKGFVPNNYFDLIRDIGGDLIEEVSLIDTYEDAEKFGEGNVSYAYRIVYRSNERTLTGDEVSSLHAKLEEETRKQFGAEIR